MQQVLEAMHLKRYRNFRQRQGAGLGFAYLQRQGRELILHTFKDRVREGQEASGGRESIARPAHLIHAEVAAVVQHCSHPITPAQVPSAAYQASWFT